MKDQGQLDDAIACFHRALEMNPNSAEVHSNLVYALPFHPDYDAETIFEEHRRWNEKFGLPLAKRIRASSQRAITQSPLADWIRLARFSRSRCGPKSATTVSGARSPTV